MKQVASATDPLHARLLVGILEENGIETIIQGESLWFARGEIPFTPDTAPSVWVVQDEDASKAIELLARHEGRVNPDRCRQCDYDLRGLTVSRCPECGTPFRVSAEWTCADCGEKSPTQFSHCWNCGAPQEDGLIVIPHTATQLSYEQAAAIGQPNPNCPQCRGSGTRKESFITGVCIFIGFAFGIGMVQRLASLRFARNPLEIVGEAVFFALVAAAFAYLSTRFRNGKCPCTEEY